MNEEKLDYSIKFRLTEKEKNDIRQYAAEHHLTISEFVRMACRKIFTCQEQK